MSGAQQDLLTYRHADAAKGEALKEAGIAKVSASNAEFVATMRGHAERIARERGAVHIDDLRFVASKRGLAPKSSAAWGSLFAQRGRWRKVGYRPSQWVTNHGHVSPIWEFVE